MKKINKKPFRTMIAIIVSIPAWFYGSYFMGDFWYNVNWIQEPGDATLGSSLVLFIALMVLVGLVDTIKDEDK